MSKKHYILFAEMFAQAYRMATKGVYDSYTVTSLLDSFMLILKRDNPRFDEDTFMKYLSKVASDLDIKEMETGEPQAPIV